MQAPQVMRPHFPKGYVDNPKRLLAWEEVERELVEARHYWLCSVRPDGRPHAVPRWAVWVDGRIYYDGSPETRHARNIAHNPNVSVHLESGERAVILEGTSKEMKPAQELALRIAQEYGVKYAKLGYAPQPDSWDAGGLFAITPQQVIAWTSFAEDPTKFVFVPSPA
jgi:nitroimidazol reductase NimA-like FMN-containing flavoprotein (pyridoxamine 5'-phosphate oxidase superfamily)